MSEDKIGSMIKDSLMALQSQGERPSSRCPADEELAEYADGVISGAFGKQGLLSHITECGSCFSKVASAVSVLTRFDNSMPEDYDKASIKKAQSIPGRAQRSKLNIMGRNKYLYISAAFFLLSFLQSRFFLQFLAAAVVFGFKWVMDTGGSKALIMIYDVWQHRRDSRREEGAGRTERHIRK